MLAYIATTGLFGYVFAFLSSVQKPMLLFVANGVRLGFRAGKTELMHIRL